MPRALAFDIFRAMPGCCSIQTIADHFGRDTAREESRRYRRDGALATTRALVEALVANGVAGADVLDVGAGIGAIHHALLERGARRAVHVDISPEYVEAAREESSRRGQIERVRFVTADFVEISASIDSADVVTLDRVICCYPNMEQLVSKSAEKARRLYGAVYPRETWWIRAGILLQNVIKRLRRSPFRSYLHSPAAIERVLRRAGFERHNIQRTWVWEVVVYHRNRASTQAT